MHKILSAAIAVFLAFTGAAHAQALTSRLTVVEVKAAAPSGEFNGVAYVKISGVAHGVVDAREAVVGISALPKNAAGQYEYASNFEIIAPAQGQPANEVVYVDSENRGSAISQGALGGFLQNHKTSYARVQWQAGISAGVPEGAQGVGLVVMRDFGRWLGGKTPAPAVSGGFVPPSHGKLMLGGISQSAWLVNTLIAEGFNIDPVTGKGVFDAAIAVDGIGNWLAINQMAAKRGVTPTPYVEPNGPPMSRGELLSRPQTDPLYIDVANYTDFYRLRAGLTSTDYSSAKFRRYDFPSPHAVGTAQGGARCNNGQPIVFNTIRYAPYMRALVLGMEKAIGVRAAQGAKALPPSKVFTLAGQPAASDTFNGLPGKTVPVPAVDASAWPVGGVRFPEAEHPLGRPVPAAVSPVVTTSIAATCGNFGGFEPFTADALVARHGSKSAWLKAYGASVDALISQGFLLAEDRAGMLQAAENQWPKS